MKIQAINYRTKQAIANTTIQLQVKGVDSGYLSYKTDNYGYFDLDDKYEGQQIAYYTQGANKNNQYVYASEGAELYIDTSTVKTSETTK